MTGLKPLQNISEHFDRLTQATSLHQTGQLAEAEIQYRELLQENPDDVNALHMLGVLEHQRGNSPKGLELVARAMQLAPGIPMIHNNFGEILLTLGQTEKATTHLLKATQEDPDKLQPLYNLGECYRRSGKLLQAENCLLMLLKKAPDHAGALLRLGMVCMDKKNPSSALEFLERAQSFEPLNIEILFQLSRVHFALKNYQDSIDILERLIRQSPDYFQAHNNLGNAFMETGDFGKAVTAYRHAASGMPGDIGINHNLAEAVKAFRQASPVADNSAEPGENTHGH